MNTATPYQRAFVQSAVGHMALLTVAFAVALLSRCARPVEPEEIIADVAIIDGPQSLGEMGVPPLESARKEDEPPAPAPAPQPPPAPAVREPDPEPIREPDPPKIKEPDKPAEKIPEKPPDPPKKPEPKKPDLPKPEPPRPEPPKPEVRKPREIVRSTNLVTRKVEVASAQPQKPSGPQKSALTSAQIQRMMNLGMPTSVGGGAGFGGGPPGSVASGNPSSGAELYKSALKAKLYTAWNRPVGVDGLLTIVRMSIARSGEITSSTITRRSGNADMDNSALEAVRRCRPASLPAAIPAPFVVDIEFDASGVRT